MWEFLNDQVSQRVVILKNDDLESPRTANMAPVNGSVPLRGSWSNPITGAVFAVFVNKLTIQKHA